MATAFTEQSLRSMSPRAFANARYRTATGVVIALVTGLISAGLGLWSTKSGAQPLLKLARLRGFSPAVAHADSAAAVPIGTAVHGGAATDSEAPTMLRVRYHYRLDDVAYEGSDEQPSGAASRSTVAIYYDPRRPERSFIAPQRDLPHLLLWGVEVAVGLLLLLFGTGLLFALPTPLHTRRCHRCSLQRSPKR